MLDALTCGFVPKHHRHFLRRSQRLCKRRSDLHLGLPFDLELRSLRAICGPLKTARCLDLGSVFTNEEHLASRRADRVSAWVALQQRRNGVGAVESATPKASILAMSFGASRCANLARCIRGLMRRAPELTRSHAPSGTSPKGRSVYLHIGCADAVRGSPYGRFGVTGSGNRVRGSPSATASCAALRRSVLSL